MNLRIYLRLLSPLWTIAMMAAYGFSLWDVGHRLFRMDVVTAHFVAATLSLPLLAGIFLAGAIFEPLHRPFAVVLPGIRQRLRHWHIAALAMVTGGFTLIAWKVDPTISWLADFGLIAAALALPSASGRSQILGLMVVTAWATFCLFGAGALRPMMQAQPWLFFITGLAVAAAFIKYAFSPAVCRQRASRYFSPLQRARFVIFNPALQARLRYEVGQDRLRDKPRRKIGSDWTVHPMCASTWAWMRVVWHGQCGAARRTPWAGLFALSISPVIPLLLVLMAGLGLAAAIIRLPSGFTFWSVLAHIADVIEFGSGEPIRQFAAGFVGIMLPLFAVLMSLFHPRPQLAYPISRAKQAHVVFFLGVGQLGAAYAVQLVAVMVLSFLGQVLSRDYLAGLGVLPVVALGVPILIAGPFMLAAVAQRNASLRILGSVVAGVGLVGLALMRTLWLPSLLSATGMALVLGTTAAGVGLYWLSVRSHYRRDDLLPAGISGEVPMLQVTS